MFKIIFTPEAIRQLKKLKRYHAATILDAIEKHLAEEPERTGKTSIKRLRGQQEAIFRLRMQDYRIFYDVSEDEVEITQILHKSETTAFYREETE